MSAETPLPTTKVDAESTESATWTQFLKHDLPRGIGLELELLAVAVSTGVLDVVTFPDYHVFVSNQTGNTVLLAVGTFKQAQETIDLRNVGVSLGCFILAGFCFGQLGDIFGRTRRWWLITTSAIQAILVFVATALRHWISKRSTGSGAEGVIALLALSGGAQVAMAKGTPVTEIPTAVITTAYIDFLSDLNLFKPNNHSRNLRLAYLLSMIAGAFIGAAASDRVSPAFAMLLSAIIKTGIVVGLFFNKAAK